MKQPEDMTADEAASEFQHLDSYCMRCKESGQGVNSKEFVRFRLVADRLHELGLGRDYESAYHQGDATMIALVWEKNIAALKKHRKAMRLQEPAGA